MTTRYLVEATTDGTRRYFDSESEARAYEAELLDTDAAAVLFQPLTGETHRTARGGLVSHADGFTFRVYRTFTYYGAPRTVRAKANSRDAMEALGLDPNRHLPEAGLSPRTVYFGADAVTAWVLSKAEAKAEAARRRSRFAHRIYVACPVCSAPVPFGRTHQHKHS